MSPILNHDHYTVMASVGVHPGRDLKFTVDRASSWNATTLNGGGRYTTHFPPAYVVD
ncbi:hypothetical protein MK139_12090 [bacterium]|nr:hypothetical protein [bacterium]